ncbi:aldehyde ferredoxin oxidoreductase [Thermoplasmatales archaeon ex4572_165]|nr:MAG: aldehyde ferredoxin oxidoreductase [Thermoplasmatales archaeon ex4572_165]
MSGGYTGKILEIDVTTQKTFVSDTDLDFCKQFIGAKGLGAKILFDTLPKNTDPLSPENLLLFTTGPLTGTKIQTSGRGTVVTKSPSTGLYLDSHFGGIFASDMKKAGWDVINIKGKSEKPIYIEIKDDLVTFHDAKDLWGMECQKTHEKLQKIHGKMRTAVIGPAGENLVKFSSITIEGHRHAGRGGPGAVMGSKNVKAIIVSGSKKVPLHDEDAYNAQAKEILKKIKENDFVPLRKQFGTPYWVKPVNDEGFIPTRNFQEGQFEHGDDLSAETMVDHIVDSSGACFNCIIACWNKSSIKQGPHKGISLVGPEYETLALMGTNLEIKTVEEVAFLNERCNELGMDTISLGCVLGFAIEAYQKGLIEKKDLNDINIDWGDTEEIARFIHAIAYRKGKAADILSEGVKYASEQFGKNSSSYAIHAKGLEIPGYDPRGTNGMGIAYATSDRGGCHQRAWVAKAELYDPELDRFSFEKKAKMVKEIQDERAAFFSLVLCDFAPISEEDCVEMWNHATGFDHTVDSYLKCGERIWNLIRLFNIREGLKENSDILPERFFTDSFSKGPAKDRVLSKKEFQQSIQEYYQIRGWDQKGIPTEKKLKTLGLDSYKK